MKEDHGRAERLLEGLGHIIKGKASLSDWSKRTKGQASVESAYSEPPKPSSTRLMQQPEPYQNTSRMNSTLSVTTETTMSPTKTLVNSSDPPAGSTATPPTSIAPPPLSHGSEGTDIDVGFDSLPAIVSVNDVQSAAEASIAVRQAFSRAADLIREGMDLDAACFLEVSQNEWFRHVRERKMSSGQKDTTDSNTPSQSSSESAMESSNETDSRDDGGVTDVSSVNSRSDRCHRLGYSTRTKSSLAGSTITRSSMSIPANLLMGLTGKYPDGQIFHFDSSGSISSGDAKSAS
ncbi:hypothetical protein LTR51_008703 [Lithohypha guttulata]|nr:hypothetical protein LTR51_008703 [Lithohypha guttulata]